MKCVFLTLVCLFLILPLSASEDCWWEATTVNIYINGEYSGSQTIWREYCFVIDNGGIETEPGPPGGGSQGGGGSEPGPDGDCACTPDEYEYIAENIIFKQTKSTGTPGSLSITIDSNQGLWGNNLSISADAAVFKNGNRVPPENVEMKVYFTGRGVPGHTKLDDWRPRAKIENFNTRTDAVPVNGQIKHRDLKRYVGVRKVGDSNARFEEELDVKMYCWGRHFNRAGDWLPAVKLYSDPYRLYTNCLGGTVTLSSLLSSKITVAGGFGVELVTGQLGFEVATTFGVNETVAVPGSNNGRGYNYEIHHKTYETKMNVETCKYDMGGNKVEVTEFNLYKRLYQYAVDEDSVIQCSN
ncbi:MAG: hypothetical protein QNK37_29015 [Acidobacteriota bacterium]|nr:hypothetical protein [Acidobacteriota bacterium]